MTTNIRELIGGLESRGVHLSPCVLEPGNPWSEIEIVAQFTGELSSADCEFIQSNKAAILVELTRVGPRAIDAMRRGCENALAGGKVLEPPLGSPGMPHWSAAGKEAMARKQIEPTIHFDRIDPASLDPLDDLAMTLDQIEQVFPGTKLVEVRSRDYQGAFELLDSLAAQIAGETKGDTEE